MKILFIKPSDQNPFQHSFMKGVLIDEFGKRKIPVYLIQQSRQGSKALQIEKKDMCTVYTLPYLYSKWLPSVLYNQFINPLILLFWILIIIKRNEITHVIVRNEWWSLLFVSLIRKFWRMPLFYQEAWPVEEHGLSRINGSGIRVKWGRAVLSFRKYTKYMLLRKCDHIFVMSKRMEEKFLKMGYPKESLSQLPMGISENVAGQISIKDSGFKLLDSGCKFIIVYSGTLSEERLPEVMLRAFEMAWQENPDLMFLIVGGQSKDIERLKIIHNEINDHEKYYVTGFIPHEQVFSYLKEANVGISIIPPDDLFVVGSVTKIVEMMACNLPVIANIEIPEQEELYKETRAIIPCYFDEHSIAESILRAFEMKEKLVEVGNAGREYVLKNRNYSVIAENLLRVLKSEIYKSQT